MTKRSYMFGNSDSRWVSVYTETDPVEVDYHARQQFTQQLASLHQLRHTLLARKTMCILRPTAGYLMVYCPSERMETLLQLSIPGGLWAGNPRCGMQRDTDVSREMIMVARANDLVYTTLQQKFGGRKYVSNHF